MHRYILKRLVFMIPVLLAVIFIVFAIMSLTPGDPGRIILGSTASRENVARLNTEFGYDKPFPIRFIDYVMGIVTRLDFGKSYRTRQPVFNEIAARFPTTLKLAALSIVLSSAIGVFLGIMSAIRQYSLLDTFSTILALFFASIPGFWFGMMMIIYFALVLRWLPSFGVSSWKGFVLPTVTMSLSSMAGLLRLTRSTMLETIRQDYIRTARAKGAPEKTVIWKHALKNALLPVVTVLGMNFGTMLGGTIITETVFAIPGLGTCIVEAIRMKDIPVVLGATVVLSTLFCLIMLAVDILYAFIDPRVRAKYVG